EVKVIVTDPAGNVSKEAVAVVDGKAPNLPVIDPVNATDPITGTAEPGSKVSVTFPDGTTAETTAGPDGKWAVATPGVKDGGEVKVIATDAAGNPSAESTSRVDGQAPNLPVIDPVNATDPITGTAEPDSKVSVTFPDGTTAETTAGPDGKWSVANPGLKDGDEVKVIVTDPAGNVSEEAVAVVDGVAPNVPEVTGFDGETVVGQAEPNSTVEVKDAAGNILGTAKADAEGNFSVALDSPVADGTEVKVTAT